MSKAFVLLIEQVDRQIADIEQKMAMVQSSLKAGLQSVESLKLYAGQYRESLSLSGKEPISGLEISFGNQFEKKLVKSLEKQMIQNDKFRSYLAAAQQDLLILNAKKKGYQSIIDKREKEALLKETRQEQKLCDELANLAFFRNKLNA